MHSDSLSSPSATLRERTKVRRKEDSTTKARRHGRIRSRYFTTGRTGSTGKDEIEEQKDKKKAGNRGCAPIRTEEEKRVGLSDLGLRTLDIGPFICSPADSKAHEETSKEIRSKL